MTHPPYTLPDFLNLGVARPPPRGATAFAPRAALVMPFALNDAYPRRPMAFQRLLLNVFALVHNEAINGQPTRPIQFTPLLPNATTTGSAGGSTSGTPL
jgi:hypothetical protein